MSCGEMTRIFHFVVFPFGQVSCHSATEFDVVNKLPVQSNNMFCREGAASALRSIQVYLVFLSLMLLACSGLILHKPDLIFGGSA